jgi:hypothetical protein
MKHTKAQLIERWLKEFPNDAGHPDLEHNALAGMVLCNDGFYRDWVTYELMKRKGA